MPSIVGVCKYCGCTEEKPCILGPVVEDGGLRVAAGGVLALVRLPQQQDPSVMAACAWFDEDQDLCDAPVCIEKAYRQAVEKSKIENV
jgi:hypothetical protein